ncbi:MAG: beta-ketoacyl synthase chain length factor [Alphaproteobacteria bacterium]
MNSARFHLRGWKSWAPSQNAEKAEGIPALLRRRVTPLGQQALSAAWNLPETADARLILTSRHGEFSRTLSLLESVANKDDLSPADFTLSVHHALVGVLSIVQGNRKGHTAVASGEESFCFGLLEAVACLKENPNEPVVLIHFDDLLPGPFATFNQPDEQPVALALALSAAGEGEAFQVESTPHPLNDNPTASHAQHFLDFLTSGSTEGLSIGEYRQWRWARHAVP